MNRMGLIPPKILYQRGHGEPQEETRGKWDADGNDQRRQNKQLETTKEYLGDAAELDIEGQSLGRYLDN